MPSAPVSFIAVLLPVILISICTILKNVIPQTSFYSLVKFLGEPVISILISLCISTSGFPPGLRTRAHKKYNVAGERHLQ